MRQHTNRKIVRRMRARNRAYGRTYISARDKRKRRIFWREMGIVACMLAFCGVLLLAVILDARSRDDATQARAVPQVVCEGL